MERWGQRDNSLGRFGTRFEQTAATHDSTHVSDALNSLSGLDPQSVSERLAQAPDWVHERGDRSWKARRAVNEDVLPIQNDRDVIRVCTMYELRVIDPGTRPPWLAIPTAADLAARTRKLRDVLG
jgi:hypothetical protein